MKDDPRMLFAIIALHHLSEADVGLEPEEVRGLKMILEEVVIDGRVDHEQA